METSKSNGQVFCPHCKTEFAGYNGAYSAHLTRYHVGSPAVVVNAPMVDKDGEGGTAWTRIVPILGETWAQRYVVYLNVSEVVQAINEFNAAHPERRRTVRKATTTPGWWGPVWKATGGRLPPPGLPSTRSVVQARVEELRAIEAKAPEFESVEAFLEYLAEDERKAATPAELGRLAARTGYDQKLTRRFLAEAGITVEMAR